MKASVICAFMSLVGALTIASANAEEAKGSRLAFVCLTQQDAEKFAQIDKSTYEGVSVAKAFEAKKKLLEVCDLVKDAAHVGYEEMARYESSRTNYAYLIVKHKDAFLVLNERRVPEGSLLDVCVTEKDAETAIAAYFADDDGKVGTSSIESYAARRCFAGTAKVDTPIIVRSIHGNSSRYYVIGELLADGIVFYAVTGRHYK